MATRWPGGLRSLRCPFCRKITPETDEENKKLFIERAELNDPIALGNLGSFNFDGVDHESALQYLSVAAELGDVNSIFNLSLKYSNGEGVEEDRAKERALLEKAAIAGHTSARYNLGFIETYDGRFHRAVKHWKISATLGHEMSTKALKNCYKAGYISKEDFAATLRANQAAVDATKSPQRQAAEVYFGYIH